MLLGLDVDLVLGPRGLVVVGVLMLMDQRFFISRSRFGSRCLRRDQRRWQIYLEIVVDQLSLDQDHAASALLLLTTCGLVLEKGG